jgi:hypothetical protein
MKYFKDLEIEKYSLPSTSPAHAAIKKEEKRKIYKDFLDKYLTL